MVYRILSLCNTIFQLNIKPPELINKLLDVNKSSKTKLTTLVCVPSLNLLAESKQWKTRTMFEICSKLKITIVDFVSTEECVFEIKLNNISQRGLRFRTPTWKYLKIATYFIYLKNTFLRPFCWKYSFLGVININ